MGEQCTKKRTPKRGTRIVPCCQILFLSGCGVNLNMKHSPIGSLDPNERIRHHALDSTFAHGTTRAKSTANSSTKERWAPHVFPLDQQHSVRCSYLGKGPRQWWLIFLWAFGCPFETCPNKTRRPQKTWQVVLDGHLYSMDNRRLLALLLLQGCRRHQRILARCRVLSPTDPRVAERYSQRIYRLKKDRRLGAEKCPKSSQTWSLAGGPAVSVVWCCF